jgi:hypothetical protein
MVISLLALALWAASTDAAGAEGPGEGSRIVAKVNQVDVTYDDFKIRLQLLEQERGQFHRLRRDPRPWSAEVTRRP